MVSPTDVFRSGAGLNDIQNWREAPARFTPAQRKFGEEDPISPARGAILGLLMSSALWAGLLIAGHAILRLL